MIPQLHVRLKVPPSVALCPGDGGELTTDGQTVRCRHCSGESLLGDWRSEIQGWHASTFYSDNVFHLSREDNGNG